VDSDSFTLTVAEDRLFKAIKEENNPKLVDKILCKFPALVESQKDNGYSPLYRYDKSSK
jgi:hypothetical protein